MAKSQLIFGTDPEFFSGYTKDNTIYCLPPVYFRQHLGVQAEPNGRHPIFIKLSNGTIVHEDGAAFELSATPSTNWEDLFERVNEGKKALETQILSKFPEVNDGKTYTLPTINYEVDRWQGEDEEFIYCTEFGCDPDEDAFNTEVKSRIIDASQHPFRYGGGHIHISGSKAIKEEPLLAVHSLALTVGLAAVAYSDVPELDKERTYLYGKPGKYRIQRYGHNFNKFPYTNVGIEYRTPSNRWTDNKDMAEQVFSWATIGIKILLEGGLVNELIDELREPVTKTIISANQADALDILGYIDSRI